MAQGLQKKPKSGNNTSAKPKRCVCALRFQLSRPEYTLFFQI